jgi:ankyrin repeat protein
MQSKMMELPTTGLCFTITSQNVPLVLSLLDKGASPDALDPLGYAPLHLAAIKEDAQLTTLLLKHGANPNIR